MAMRKVLWDVRNMILCQTNGWLELRQESRFKAGFETKANLANPLLLGLRTPVARSRSL
jgi:hypothetical protein